ncbi:hypothetical protein M422DRAFT_29229 [Sphaerobolus stellatus SS14]|nr:hypothetical protein M422DRAFT_29229 [Sphaerobolus stellatus SS14]
MFSFWSRKGNKSPAVGRSTNIPTEERTESEDTPKTRPIPRSAYPTSLPSQYNQPIGEGPPKEPREPISPATPNPHDAAIAEVEAKLSQAERLASTTSSNSSPTHDTQNAPIPEQLYDPATGAQRGAFEPTTYADNEKSHEEVWAHLAQMRELQSEIARMHMNMEGLGDGVGSINVEVDADIDVETVPTQEEEEAAKRQREFDKLPEKFKGRADNIEAMMAKLDELSKAVTAFHALQPPPIRFDVNPGTRDDTNENPPSPLRTSPAAKSFTPIVIPAETKFADVLHDSPTSHHHDTA